jgi:hypothetical protein
MKLLGAPRQPLVGLALMAAIGIITAEIFPLPSVAMAPAAGLIFGVTCARIARELRDERRRVI